MCELYSTASCKKNDDGMQCIAVYANRLIDLHLLFLHGKKHIIVITTTNTTNNNYYQQ
jgi:hypothetical protein